jgi:PncC family amidohydrolase
MDKEYNITINEKISRLIFNKLKDIRKRSLKTQKLMIAESLTGGMISDCLTGVAGISEFYKGSLVAYCNTIKTAVLKVSEDTLEKHGAVSAETAFRMALSLGELYGADLGVSTTGIAGPGGGSAQKPVGLVYFGFFINGAMSVERRIFTGGRDCIRRQATRFALSQLFRLIREL